MRGTGTIVNIAAVLLGGGLGLFLKNGLKERYQQILMQALGLCTMFIGAAGALKGMFQVNGSSLETGGTMLMIASLVIGSLAGEWIDIEQKMEGFGEWLKARFGGQNDNRFVEGFVATSLVICVGAMAIVGALEDGLTGDASMLYAKAVLDGVIVVVFASTYGKGALFSAVPIGIWQGGITLFAGALQPILTEQIIADMSFVGNMLIFCVGANLSFGKKFRVGNMLPALVVVILYDLILAAV
ncbi:MAG: DUF554 domain-containing protein [Candidatus Limivivens sp.]|nr:DUF554 domain-containing protein [Candidatus Limivivens sp.]